MFHIIEKKPSISVIIPYFEAHHWIAECVGSVFSQDISDIEILIMDDGSRIEAAIGALMAVAKTDSRTRVFFNPENRGPSAVRNDLISMAQGEFILPLDSDNFLCAPDSLSKWRAKIGSQRDCFAYSYYNLAGLCSGMATVPHYNLARLVWEGNYIDTCAMFRREHWERTGGYDPHIWYSEDWDLWLNFASHGVRGELIEEPLFTYRRRFNSNIQRHTPMQKRQIMVSTRGKYPEIHQGQLGVFIDEN